MELVSGFSFLDFPFEIRKQVYRSVLDGQVVHLCPNEKHEYHPRTKSEDNEEERFFDSAKLCSTQDYQSLCHEVKWSHTAQSNKTMPTPSDVLSFMLSCKIVWNELEPLIWKYVDFCVGVPQFAGFFKQFLVQVRASHAVTTPRAQLLQRASLIMVQDSDLASELGRDSRYRHLSSFTIVHNAEERSVEDLTKKCTGLQDLLIFVKGPSEIEQLGPGGILSDMHDSQVFLQFKALNSFKMQLFGNMTLDNGSWTYANAPSDHPVIRSWATTESVLADILTRKNEPSDDAPIVGVPLDDPDYVWLRKNHEEHFGHRLVELVLRTKSKLKELGVVDIPPIS